MQFFLDHLASILIASGVLLIIVFVQIRGTQSAAESVVNNAMYGDVVNMASYLQRDLENMLTDTQAADAQTSGNYTHPGGVVLCTSTDSTTGGTHSATHTTSFRFPTLNLSTPAPDDVVEVEYDLVNTGKSIKLPTQDSTQTIPIFRLNRMENGNYAGSSDDVMTSFRVESLELGESYTDFSPLSGTCTTNLRKIRFEFKMAQTGVDLQAGDQSSTSQTNISRFGATVHLSNWD